MSDRDHSNSAQGKMWSAVFYGISSILVIFTNKWLLTEFHFPYFKFVAAAQFVATSLILFMLAIFKKVDIPFITPAICKEIMPISIMFLGNVLFGLGSTKALNIPMFTALRRFSILMTMMGEWWMLDSKPHSNVVISVSLMVGGAMLAAMYDLAFDAEGYTMVFLNNIFTAMNGIWMKKASMSGKCSKMGVLFYNSLFSAAIMSVYFIAEHNFYENKLASANSLYGVASPYVSPVAAGAPSGVHARLLTPVDLFLSEQRQLADLPAPSLRGNSAANEIVLSELEKAKLRLQVLNEHIDLETNKFAELQQIQASKRVQDAPRTPEKLSPQMLAAAQLDIPSRLSKTSSVVPLAGANQSTISLVLAYPGWADWRFICMLLGTCCMGSVLNYAIFLCTTRNSALTTAVVGTMKNVFTTYIGMMIFSDYTFTWVNFLGINISIVGSLYYTYCTMKS